MPVGAASFAEALRWGAEMLPRAEGDPARTKGSRTGVGDEGGFAPELATAARRWSCSSQAIEAAGLRAGRRDRAGAGPGRLRVLRGRRATSSRADDADLRGDDRASGRTCSTRYPIVSIEDGLAEDDWDGLGGHHRGARRARCSSSATTSSSRTRSGSSAGSSEGVGQRHPRQGEPDRHAHRDPRRDRTGAARTLRRRRSATASGETEDTTIADLAVATNAGQIKAGAPSRGERTAKYNQLLRIEEELGETARYAGRQHPRSPAGARPGPG